MRSLKIDPLWDEGQFLDSTDSDDEIGALRAQIECLRRECSTRDEKLSQVEERWRFLTSNLADCIFTLNLDLTYSYVSPSSRLICGFEAGEFSGRRVDDFIHPDSFAGAADLLEEELRREEEGDLAPDRSRAIDVQHLCSDGSWRWVEARLRFARGADGKPIGIVGSVRDASERRGQQEELSRLATAVDQAGEAIMVTDLDGIIRYVNPAFETITGYSTDEVIGRTPRILKSGKQVAGFYERMWADLLAGRVWRGRLVNRRKDGRFYEEETTISPVKNSNGAITDFVAVKRDVSKLVALEQQIIQSQKMEAIGRLAGGIAHDFNNLLTSILGYSQIVGHTLGEEHPAWSDVVEVRRAAERAARLTQQLLTFSRKQVVTPRVLDVNQIIENGRNMISRLIGEDIDFVLHLDESLWRVRIDPTQIDQVIVNLCVNARDAMPGGGRLMIETRNISLSEREVEPYAGISAGEYAMIAVTDTGIGMDGATLTRIFEPFFTTKEIGKGTGLGLSTVYGIMQQNKGAVHVYSEPGVGTTFKLYFPREHELDAEDDAPAPAQTDDLPRGHERVLLVEDDELLCRLIHRVLVEGGYDVIVAADGEEAANLPPEILQSVDLLVTDVIMPRMNGRELHEFLSPLNRRLKTLFISGYSENVIAHHGVLEPGVEFLHKPFTIQAFTHKIREILESPAGNGLLRRPSVA